MLDSTTLHLFSRFPRVVGYPKRYTIRDLYEFEDFVRVNNGITDVFTCVYDSKSVVDKMFFDFDNKDDLEKAMNDVQTLHSYCFRKNIPSIPLGSGKKGFHDYVILKPLPYGIPVSVSSYLLLNAMNYLIEDVFGKEKSNSETVKVEEDTQKITIHNIDTHSIGNVAMLCRVPNTLRPPENYTYCTYLPPIAFLNMSIQEVRQHITKEHTYDYSFDSTKTLKDFVKKEDIKDLEEISEGETEKVLESMKRIPVPEGNIRARPSDSKVFLRKLIRPSLFNLIILPNPPHFARVATTVDLIHLGFTDDTILYVYSKLDWFDWSSKETQNQIESCHSLNHLYSSDKIHALSRGMR